MIKTCVFDADGKLINIGEWDERIRPVEVGTETVVVKEAVTDEEGNIVEPEVTEEQPIYENQPTNPMPDGAYTEDREVVRNADGGWRLASEPEPVTDRKRIEDLENLVVQLSLEGGD